VNLLTAANVDAPNTTTEASLGCVCHTAADCPDRTTVAINAGVLAEIGELVDAIDEGAGR
jgi:hypothetical protein